MANIPKKRSKVTTEMNTFKGIWQDEYGDTQTPEGFLSKMTNQIMTKRGRIKKMWGYAKLFATMGAFPVRTMWNGIVGTTERTIFALNGNLYSLNMSTYATTLIGAFTDTSTMSIFGFEKKVFFINGTQYKYWDGTTYADVSTIAYVPKVYSGVTPTRSVQTKLEPLNLLTGKRYEGYVGDGTAIYTLALPNLASVDQVYVGGVLKTVTTHYTVNLTTGVVTFTASNFPATAVEVLIYYTFNDSKPQDVHSNKFYNIYGIQNDTRVFLYGNTTYQNRIIYSGITLNGTPTATYFPSTGYMDIGSDNTPVKDMITTNSRFVVYKSDRPYIGSYEETSGIVNFPVFPLDTMPTKPYAQAQSCNSVPFTLGNMVMRLDGTYIRDEKNASSLSNRIQPDLDGIDLSLCKTIDYEKEMWYIISKDKWVWIYDYEIDTFSRLYVSHNITCWLEINGELYFGTDSGTIMKFSKTLKTYDGITIPSISETGFMDYGAGHLKKSIREFWIYLYPEVRSSCTVGVITSDSNNPNKVEKEYFNFDFNDIDFSNMTFSTSYNPQPFRIKIKAKKWSMIKFTIENNREDTTMTFLGITTPVTSGGKIK